MPVWVAHSCPTCLHRLTARVPHPSAFFAEGWGLSRPSERSPSRVLPPPAESVHTESPPPAAGSPCAPRPALQSSVAPSFLSAAAPAQSGPSPASTWPLAHWISLESPPTLYPHWPTARANSHHPL